VSSVVVSSYDLAVSALLSVVAAESFAADSVVPKLATSSPACFGLDPHAAATDERVSTHANEATTRADGRRDVPRGDLMVRAPCPFRIGALRNVGGGAIRTTGTMTHRR